MIKVEPGKWYIDTQGRKCYCIGKHPLTNDYAFLFSASSCAVFWCATYCIREEWKPLVKKCTLYWLEDGSIRLVRSKSYELIAQKEVTITEGEGLPE